MRDDLITTFKQRLAGPLPALPEQLDRLSERWWALPPRWRLAAVLALVAVAMSLPMLRLTRSSWGPPVSVLVAASDLAAGSQILDGAVRDQRPASLVPDDALTEASGVLTVGAIAGTVLTERHRAPDLPALLHTGEVALPVPRDLQPDLEAGAIVDLFASAFDGTGQVLARGGRVLMVDPRWMWVALPESTAARAAAAASDQRLVVAVRPRS